MADSFRVSRIFLTAVELHIFETLERQELTAREIAARTGTNERATEILLNALAGLGLIEKRRNKYADAPVIVEMLRKKSSDCLLAWFRHQNNGWRRWSALTRVVKKGYPKKNPWSQKMSIDLAMTMRLGVKNLAERLDLMMDVSKIRRICDLGCGPGAITMELLQMHPHTTAVLIDQDKGALKIARQDAVARGLQDRVEFVNQNILTSNMEKGFDMVILSSVLCLFTRQEVVHLLNKVKAILQTGGTLILGEMLLKESRTCPVPAALFAVQLLVNGSSDGAFSLSEIRDLLRTCGIRYERNFPTNLYHIIVGKNESN
jgi:ubiquinone/menaquinone biosynthesis C-methylase UbiE